MSVKVMSQVWEAENLPPTDRLILLSLADHSNDEGVCYPSIARLARRTGLSERGIQKALKRLVEAGYLAIEQNKGPKGCNLFRVTATPEPCSPPNPVHPEHGSGTPERGSPLPPNPVHPNRKGTVKNRQDVRACLCELLSQETADDFIAHRKALKKPLTPEAARRICTKLQNCRDPNWVVGLSIENGWAGVFPEQEARRSANVTKFPGKQRPHWEVMADRERREQKRKELGL